MPTRAAVATTELKLNTWTTIIGCIVAFLTLVITALTVFPTRYELDSLQKNMTTLEGNVTKILEATDQYKTDRTYILETLKDLKGRR